MKTATIYSRTQCCCGRNQHFKLPKVLVFSSPYFAHDFHLNCCFNIFPHRLKRLYWAAKLSNCSRIVAKRMELSVNRGTGNVLKTFEYGCYFNGIGFGQCRSPLSIFWVHYSGGLMMKSPSSCTPRCGYFHTRFQQLRCKSFRWLHCKLSQEN